MRVRQSLLARHDMDNDEFCRQLPNCDASLLIQTRDAVAAFFGVPCGKIYPTDQLETNFQIRTFEPGFHISVVRHVLQRRNVATRRFRFRTGDSKDLSDLAGEVQTVLNDVVIDKER